MVHVDVQVACDGAEIPGRKALAGWVREALFARPDRPFPERRLELTVRIVDESEGVWLNETYRRRCGATNVLSFPFSSPIDADVDADGQALLGDVVICAPVAAREAHAQGKEPRAHWAHLVIHGTLHLLGHDHEGGPAAERMEALECEILARLGFPDPYQVQPHLQPET